ncbi:cell division protein FtsK [Ralstonia syzygii]|uniref:cell division protein FtsK n=1 Tax=Ralstonia syzygii TaxID=28097 RepID=UPI001E487D58|nr:cell division protein FtsK [Ralstonia syzygii]
MSNQNDDVKTILNMTSATVGRDLLQALVQEIKLLPSMWVKLSKAKQDDVIDRLRKRVETNVKMAVHLIASEGRTVVAGDLDQITIKDGVKAVVKFGGAAPNLHELYEASGKAVLVVVANPAQHAGGMDEVRGESDQRAMDLGHEYDPNSDGKGMEGTGSDDDKVVDVEAIAIEHKPLTEELQKAWDDGYDAAEADEPQSACPTMKGELCIEWIKSR